MRASALLIGALALAGGSCSMVDGFGRPGPGLSDGAWRLGLHAGGLGESSEVNSVDDESSSLGWDIGMIHGDSGEFGVRLIAADFDISGADVVTGGPFLRWYFPGWAGLRPLLEVFGGLAGIDYGSGDDTGWAIGAGGGLIWMLGDRIGLEALVRQNYGDFENGDDSSVIEGVVGVSLFW